MPTKKTKTPAPKAKPGRFNRRIIAVLLAVILVWPVIGLATYGLHELQNSIDTMRFPEVSAPVKSALTDAMGNEMDDKDKARAMVTAICSQLERELDSPFGWSINDLLISPTSWLDARASRQEGVIYATRMLMQFFSPNATKLGASDKENPLTKEVREQYIVYGESIWGFFKMSSENAYKHALENMHQYVRDVQEGKAVYNFRSDDIYNVLVYILSESFTGQAMGLLTEPNEDVSYWDLNNRIYYVQGVVLVLRDFLHTLSSCYPDIAAKGGEENLAAAYRAMDRICTFYPVVVMRGRHDSIMADHRGKMARYMVTVQTRINDIAQSVRR